jgi:hypothetical protein
VDDLSSNPAGVRDLPIATCKLTLGATKISYEGFSRAKVAETWNCLTPFSAELIKVWICSSTLPSILIAWCLNNHINNFTCITFWPLTFTWIILISLSPTSEKTHRVAITMLIVYFLGIFSMAQQPLEGQVLLIIEALRSHLFRHTTQGRTPLDKWSARLRDLYLTKHNTHKRQTSIPPAEFEPAIPASERPQTHALDRATTGIGCLVK